MKSTEIGKMLKLRSEIHEKLGDVVVLTVSESDTGTPFQDAVTKLIKGQEELTSISFRLKKATAKRLALKLLKLSEEK